MNALDSNLPNFYLIGAEKCGTSSLFANIIQHPEVFKPYKKELHFFDRDENYSRGIGWYLASFYQGAEKFKAIGEATPIYLYRAEVVAPRIYDVYRGAPLKLMIILRDPVERAYSRYWHEVHRGQRLFSQDGRPISFEQALQLEEQFDKDNPDPKIEPAYSFVKGGIYAPKIKLFQQYFPPENFLILFTDDLKRDPESTFANIFRFIGVDDRQNLTSVVRNKASMPKNKKLYTWIKEKSVLKDLFKPLLSDKFRFGIKRYLSHSLLKPVTYPPMKPETEKLLREKFQGSINELEDLLGLDLSTWHAGKSGSA